MWVGLLLGLLVATVVGLMLTALAHRRGKETQFGYKTSKKDFNTHLSTNLMLGLKPAVSVSANIECVTADISSSSEP